MNHLVWTPHMALGIPSMDLAHQALIEQIAWLQEQHGRDFTQGMAQLIEHIELDFREEENLMEEIDFPGLRSHREQHARALATLHSLAEDDQVTARKVLALLTLWFEQHMASMDARLALALQQSGKAFALAPGAPLLAGDML
ncbi:hemerythrin family protein [Oxalobacteraceae bacterium]|nr:hemerythrin family protein [Oxalobacteraceae bacterium]